MKIKFGLFVFYTVYFLIRETEETNTNNIVKKCTKCPPGWGVAKKCTRKTDTQCVSCTRGRTYSSNRSSRSPCWSCSKCGIGLYESHGCSPVRDTVCNECLSYLDHKGIINNDDFQEKCTFLFQQSKESP